MKIKYFAFNLCSDEVMKQEKINKAVCLTSSFFDLALVVLREVKQPSYLVVLSYTIFLCNWLSDTQSSGFQIF